MIFVGYRETEIQVHCFKRSEVKNCAIKFLLSVW